MVDLLKVADGIAIDTHTDVLVENCKETTVLAKFLNFSTIFGTPFQTDVNPAQIANPCIISE